MKTLPLNEYQKLLKSIGVGLNNLSNHSTTSSTSSDSIANLKVFLQKKTASNLDKKIDTGSSYLKIGVVKSVSDGIVKVSGLFGAMYGEDVSIVISLSDKKYVKGLVSSLNQDEVLVISLENSLDIKPGQLVLKWGYLLNMPVSPKMLGRVVNPVGTYVDVPEEEGSISSEDSLKELRGVEKIAPSIIARSGVNESLETGLKVVDSMVPIGHGQRELIIGDSKTGKTSIALDTILNQKGKEVICIYVAIGQKRSSVARIVKTLKDNDCLKYTVIVSATAGDNAAMQYIAPYAGCAVGEYFMDKGFKCLVVYDDLSKHATSYRQLSLLLRRPPGREGYPGDVFYAHSRLLERSANLKAPGSLTALPIIETIQSDVSGYVPTNVISITDGQIFMDTELFSRGIRPAVSPGLSVSRVGSAAQSVVLRKMAGTLKLELAQYREVEGFVKLGFELDDATKQLVDRGIRLTQLLVQKRFNPIPVNKQILFLYTTLQGYIDWLPASLVSLYESELFKFLDNSNLSYPLSWLDKELDKDLINYIIWHFTNNFLAMTNSLKLN